jgi:hypothetical protein
MVESLRDVSSERQEGCTHHWRIASPCGESSTGVCKICGATREFQNYAYRSSMSRLRKPASSNRASSNRASS